MRRAELGNQALERLEGLLGTVAVEAGDLLRFGDEGFIGRAGELGLGFQRLVERLHAGQLFDKRLGVLERLLGVVAIGGRDRLDSALQIVRGSGNRFKLLFSVILNVFNLHHWNPFPRPRLRKPMIGEPTPQTRRQTSAGHNQVKKYCALHKNFVFAENPGLYATLN